MMTKAFTRTLQSRSGLIFFAILAIYNLLLGIYLKDFLVLSPMLLAFYLLSVLPPLLFVIRIRSAPMRAIVYADTDESDEEEGKPASEPVILPCRTLSQLWKAEIHEFKANDRVGTQLRSDIFLWYKDFNRFFVCRDDLGKRVLALRPRWPVNRSNAILFAAFSTDLKTNVRKKKNFVLVFDDRREYNQACKKLFVRNTASSGISTTAPKYSMVLVAGDWTELDEEKYMAYKVETGDYCYGAQISNFSSKNQIYALQKYKIKQTKEQRS